MCCTLRRKVRWPPERGNDALRSFQPTGAALGAAIIHRPPVLFLDEPFEGVDAVSARLIRNLLRQAAASGTTIIFSSHEMHLVEKLCTRIGIMVEGRLTIEETPDGLCRITGKDNIEDAFISAVGGDTSDESTWYAGS